MRTRRQRLSTDNSVGKRVLEALGSRDFGWLSSQTGIPTSTISDYVLRGISRADNAVKIARALDRSVEWLFGGSDPQSLLIDSSEADWVQLPRYDLSQITERGKGLPLERVPIRRDWLYRKLHKTSDIWLTELPASNHRLRLVAGDIVICEDIIPGAGPYEGWVCIWIGPAGPLVAQYTVLARQLHGGAISPAAVVESELQAIARIRAAMLSDFDESTNMWPAR